MIIASVITSIASHLLVVIMVATVSKKEWYSEMIYVPYIGNFTEENICEFRGFWNDREFHRFWNDRKCFLATILYFVIILTKNVHC